MEEWPRDCGCICAVWFKGIWLRNVGCRNPSLTSSSPNRCPLPFSQGGLLPFPCHRVVKWTVAKQLILPSLQSQWDSWSCHSCNSLRSYSNRQVSEAGSISWSPRMQALDQAGILSLGWEHAGPFSREGRIFVQFPQMSLFVEEKKKNCVENDLVQCCGICFSGGSSQGTFLRPFD